jgi:hypothetical protein
LAGIFQELCVEEGGQEEQGEEELAEVLWHGASQA